MLQSRTGLARSISVGLALFPVGLLFGLTAAQNGWRPMEVFALSAIGFTGSGQFALLALTKEGVAPLLIFLIILLINLRYVPMAFTAARGMDGAVGKRATLAHFVSDESYAVEQIADPPAVRASIRLWIALFWVASTTAGALVAMLLPAHWAGSIGAVTFPANALLILLALLRVRAFVERLGRRGLAAILASLPIALGIRILLGSKLFWLPSILLVGLTIHWICKARDAS
ncbi:hypothetical protein CYFUS_005712 [Cystobacter fuscus]|uniref:Branched-chain amino acid ABC transporter permease n=1 Tax=Cystobacter fuscus TaxID=43 RepID=A0A250J8P3_9BACT|nr:AzlC family ABC transporter permease [Cystobacter fuscus]ATB40264.1 hypothetical protein CYFUS_005712 [Cystobacter fuscus]